MTIANKKKSPTILTIRESSPLYFANYFDQLNKDNRIADRKLFIKDND